MAGPTQAPMTVGAIWQGIVAALRPDFGVYFALVAPFTLLVSMAVEIFGPPVPRSIAEFTPKMAVQLLLIPSIIGAIGQLALTWLIASPGGTPRRAIGVAVRALPLYFAAVLLITPATTLGLLLLVVPGLYLFARFLLLGPVLVIEAPGTIAALRRSWVLTADSGWTIVLFLVLALLFVFGAGVLANGVGAALGLLFTALGLKAVGGFASALVAATVSTLFTMASAAAGVVIYRRLAV
jgi:hypothetical protein